MRIRVFYCGAKESAMNVVERARVAAVFASCADGRCIVEPFESVEALMPALGDSLREDDVSAVYVSAETHLALKRAVYELLELNVDISKDIYALLPETLPEAEKQLYALFASSSVMFPSADGIDTASCTATGRGNFMLIPANADSVAVTETKIADWFARKIVVAPSPEQTHVKLCRDAADVLFERHLTVAVANTATVEYLRSPAKDCGDRYACFKFVDVAPDGGGLSPKEYAAHLASRAAWEENTALGCALSNVYKIEKDGAVQYLVYLAVSVDNNVALSRAVSRGEELSVFLKRAAKELFSLLVCAVTDQNDAPENVDFDVF